jgi:uncharacterized protein YggT (Ycf19 family)
MCAAYTHRLVVGQWPAERQSAQTVDALPDPLQVRQVAALVALLDLYSIVVLISVVGSWVRSDNVVFRFADQLTEPVLDPIRKVIPPAGGFDLSPMLLLLGLRLLSGALH